MQTLEALEINFKQNAHNYPRFTCLLTHLRTYFLHYRDRQTYICTVKEKK